MSAGLVNAKNLNQRQPSQLLSLSRIELKKPIRSPGPYRKLFRDKFTNLEILRIPPRDGTPMSFSDAEVGIFAPFYLAEETKRCFLVSYDDDPVI